MPFALPKKALFAKPKMRAKLPTKIGNFAANTGFCTLFLVGNYYTARAIDRYGPADTLIRP
ncbi:uncharacterized protein N7515_006094 [Penicillium bovifimosum]|uniref:Uncharacterized protein n=1 Tax=Penicillium bovifimosum TaxID=126998 RepID=A0A9W9L0S8_9EURO|nr:uncharacterized protein N7515_006094 [Penicillium bovifimosum]KAJ5130055.1 hypothetical protein N7515_006094 [Penicillium bovifimosum]